MIVVEVPGIDPGSFGIKQGFYILIIALKSLVSLPIRLGRLDLLL